MARNIYGLDLGSYEIKVYDKKKDMEELNRKQIRRYIEMKERQKISFGSEMRRVEVEYEQVWKEMTSLLPEEMETLADGQLVQKIKQLDIYNSFLNDSMMRVDFQPGGPAYNKITPAQLFEWIIRRHKFHFTKGVH